MSFIQKATDSFFKSESSLGILGAYKDNKVLREVEKLTDEFEKVSDKTEKLVFGKDVIPKGVAANLVIIGVVGIFVFMVLRRLRK